MDRSSRSAVAAVVAICLFPWIVLHNGPGDLTLVMSWGLVNTNPWHVLGLPGYLGATQGFGTLPWSLQVWPISFGFYCGAVVSATGGVVANREDPRLTAGLLVLSAVGSVFVWQGLLGRGIAVAIPVGTVATGVVAWWFYAPALRQLTAGRQPPE